MTGTESLTLVELMAVTATKEPGVFRGKPEAYGPLGIYGGHFLGQAVAAGFETVEQPKLVHSFHAYFLRRGDPETQILYSVDSLRDGAGTDVRSVAATQNGVEIFHMIVSFKTTEAGDEHQTPSPTVEAASSLIEARKSRGDPVFPFPPIQHGRAEMEWASPSFLEHDGNRAPALRLWVRIPGGEDLDERACQVVQAFLSDGTLMFNSALPHGTPMTTHRLTSLDQSVWFHRKADPGQWMLFDQRSTNASDGRGMNQGEMYSSDGALILSCAQESMLRRISPKGPAPGV